MREREPFREFSRHPLTFRFDGEANSIAWLVWHLTRIQDDHIADASTAEQIWTSGGRTASPCRSISPLRAMGTHPMRSRPSGWNQESC